MSQDVGFVLRCARSSRNGGVRSHESRPATVPYIVYRHMYRHRWGDHTGGGAWHAGSGRRAVGPVRGVCCVACHARESPVLHKREERMGYQAEDVVQPEVTRDLSFGCSGRSGRRDRPCRAQPPDGLAAP
eukprot:3469637-Prymnesium_polylepis.1